MGGRIFLFLFGLVFFSGGAFAGYSMGASLLDWQKMQSWESVSANVTNGGYKTTSSDDGETYKAYAEYTYRYDGRSYTGTRVAIDDMSDNIGNFHQDLGKRLENAAENGKPVTVFVNPDNPAESVVSRDMRWGMFGFKSIFLIAFGGIGLLVMVSAIRMPKPKDISGFDSTPWLVNNNWKTPEIKSEAQFAVRFMWGFALFWCLISAPLPFMLFEEVVEKKNYPALLGLLFPLIGVLLIAKAVHVTAEWRKFGEATVTLDPYPGSIGGQVGGFLELNWPFNAATKVILTLTNAYSYESGSGKNRRREEDIKWQDKIVAYTESGLYGTRILFRFDVPAGLEPSDALKVSNMCRCKSN